MAKDDETTTTLDAVREDLVRTQGQAFVDDHFTRFCDLTSLLPLAVGEESLADFFSLVRGRAQARQLFAVLELACGWCQQGFRTTDIVADLRLELDRLMGAWQQPCDEALQHQLLEDRGGRIGANPLAELIVLASIVADPRLIPTVRRYVRAESFAVSTNGTIFAAVCRVTDARKAPAVGDTAGENKESPGGNRGQ